MSTGAVIAKLGGKKALGNNPRSEAGLIAAIRKGLPVAALDSVLESFSLLTGLHSALYNVVGRPRTLQRKRTERSALSADESDRLARLARIMVRAEEVFGDDAKAHAWLGTPNRALGGESPLSLLDSDAGSLAVQQVLGRIEHGVYS